MKFERNWSENVWIQAQYEMVDVSDAYEHGRYEKKMVKQLACDVEW